jgi:hypothetical protein
LEAAAPRPGGIAARVLDAYGGWERWRRAHSVAVTVSAGGLAFSLKGCPELRSVRAEAQVHRPFVRTVPGPDRVEVFDAGDVRIESGDGRVRAERRNARWFPYGRRALWWDELDCIYFRGYALWGYLTLPALLLRPDVQWREVGPHSLEARFPDHLPAHSRVQRYHFDAATGLLRQNDYTVEVLGAWAEVAHVVLAHGIAQGVPFTAHRRALRRRGDGTAQRWPVLVEIRLSEFEVRDAR